MGGQQTRESVLLPFISLAMLNTPTYFTDSDSRESRRELTSDSSRLDR